MAVLATSPSQSAANVAALIPDRQRAAADWKQGPGEVDQECDREGREACCDTDKSYPYARL